MSELLECEVCVVGGGLSGLACATLLQGAGVDWQLLEAEPNLGGRVRTERRSSGFLLDRGFQVLNTAYPALARLVDLEKLELGSFASGAEVFQGGRFHRIGDPLRNPETALTTLLAPVGSLRDKVRILELLRFCRDSSRHEALRGLSTEEFLTHFGFRQEMLEGFFRPFFGGVFLEEELLTNAAKFASLFSFFSRGEAALPRKGMQALPELLASPLPPERLHLSEPVQSLEAGLLVSQNLRIKARTLILAGWGAQATLLELPVPPCHSSHTVWFAAEERASWVNPYLKLNGSPHGSLQTVAVQSQAQPSYAPEGSELVAVSLRRNTPVSQVQEELEAWFGETVRTWQPLHTDHISEALPQEFQALQPLGSFEKNGIRILCCGDHTETGSIQGALNSGRRSALLALKS